MFEKRTDSSNEAPLFCAGKETSRADDVYASSRRNSPSCSLVKEQFASCDFFRKSNSFGFSWIKQWYKLWRNGTNPSRFHPRSVSNFFRSKAVTSLCHLSPYCVWDENVPDNFLQQIKLPDTRKRN